MTYRKKQKAVEAAKDALDDLVDACYSSLDMCIWTVKRHKKFLREHNHPISRTLQAHLSELRRQRTVVRHFNPSVRRRSPSPLPSFPGWMRKATTLQYRVLKSVIAIGKKAEAAMS